MLFKKTIERISFLDYLIRSKKTGNIAELAEKLGVSERTMFYYIAEFKELGAPVFWSESDKSYLYDYPVKFGLNKGFEELSPSNYTMKSEKSWPAGGINNN